MTDPQHSSPVTAGLPHRDFDKRPYSPDEQRVAEFIFERGGGGGDDPIGFILASYAYLVQERNELRCPAQTQQEPVEAEIEAWIRTLDDEKDRNLVMWRERALRAEKELSEINGKLFAPAQSSLNAAEDAIKRQQGIKPDADVLARDLVAAGECEYAQRASIIEFTDAELRSELHRRAQDFLGDPTKAFFVTSTVHCEHYCEHGVKVGNTCANCLGAAVTSTEREVCPVCMGSGYSNHPDSGEVCQACKGQGDGGGVVGGTQGD